MFLCSKDSLSQLVGNHCQLPTVHPFFMCKRSSLQELEFIDLKEAVVHIFLESLLAFTTQLLHPAKPVTRCEVCNPHLLHALHLLQTLHHLIPHSPIAEFCVFFILIECPKAVPIIGVSPVHPFLGISNIGNTYTVLLRFTSGSMSANLA